MGGHGFSQGCKTGAKLAVARATGQAGVAPRQVGQRHGVVGRRAAVNTRHQVCGLQAHGTRHVAAYRLLQGMRGRDVVVQAQPVLYAIGQKARMFAAAVVVPLVKYQIGRRRLVQQREQPGHMAAAAQRAAGQSGLCQHALCRGHMHVFTVVAGAQQRHLAGAETKLRRPAGLHKRQSLQCFEGGAGKRQPVRVACAGHQAALCVGYSDGANMLAFQCVGAGQFY